MFLDLIPCKGAHRCPILGVYLQRLFSTFADGWPGTGLLILRLVAGICLGHHALNSLGEATPHLTRDLIAAGCGLLLAAGLWTPVAGALVAAMELWTMIARPDDVWTHLLLGTLGASLAMLGPGAWSIDARLFGRRRIEIPDR